MIRKLQNKSLLIFAIIGLLGAQLINAQEYTFTGGLQGWAQAFGAASQVEHSESEGESGDGALTVIRTSNNSGFGFNPAGVNADSINYIRIKFKNLSNATSFRVQGAQAADNSSGVLGNQTYTITPNNSNWETIYMNVSGITNWSGTVDNLDILVRGAYASGEGNMFIDEVEFLSLPDTFKGMVQNAGFDDVPNAIGIAPWDPANKSFATVTTSTDEFHDGTQSMKHTYSSDPNSTHFVFNDYIHDFGTTKSNSGKITMWVKVVRPSTPGVSPLITIQGQFRTGTTLVVNQLTNKASNVTTTKTDGTWERLTYNITPNASYSTGQFRYGILATNLLAGDIVYVDEICAFAESEASTPGTWEAAGTWGGTAPTQADRKTIDSDITINSSVISDGPVIINSSNTLTITTGNSLTLNSDLETSDGLVLQLGAQLIVKGSATGNTTYQRTLTATDNGAAANLEGWFSVSPPVSGEALNTAWADANSLATGTGGNRGLATYVENGDTWSYFSGTATTFEAGKGYIVKRTTDGTIEFEGTINTSDSGVNVTVTNDGNGFNLLGNPYTSQINSATFLSENASNLAQQQIWVWNDNGNSYEAKTAGMSFMLSPGQAFFVQANGGATLNFSEANQAVGGADTFQKSEESKLRLKIANGKLSRYAEVYYLDNGTTAFDSGFEGEVFRGIPDSFSLYTKLLDGNASKDYQIQTLPNSNMENMVIPVGVKVDKSAEFEFSLDAVNIPDGLNVYLEDRQKNTFIQLGDSGANYKVSLSEVSNGIGRFYLHTKSAALSSETEDLLLNSVRIFTRGNRNLEIAGLSNGSASVSLFNILGKEVMSANFAEANTNETLVLPVLQAGVYIVQLTTTSGKLSKKIILE